MRIIDNGHAVQVDYAPGSSISLGALARLGHARALRLAGDGEAARKEYNSFFALWKDADPNIPILMQAKSEYAKL